MTTKTASTKTASTKKAQAMKVYARMSSRKTPATRQQILAEMESKLGLTAACAATYYQNIKSGKWA